MKPPISRLAALVSCSCLRLIFHLPDEFPKSGSGDRVTARIDTKPSCFSTPDHRITAGLTAGLTVRGAEEPNGKEFIPTATTGKKGGPESKTPAHRGHLDSTACPHLSAAPWRTQAAGKAEEGSLCPLCPALCGSPAGGLQMAHLGLRGFTATVTLAALPGRAPDTWEAAAAGKPGAFRRPGPCMHTSALTQDSDDTSWGRQGAR